MLSLAPTTPEVFSCSWGGITGQENRSVSSPSNTHKAKPTLALQMDQRAEECICWIQFSFLYACGFQTLTAQKKEVVVAQSLSRVLLFETPWTAARQASLPFTISQSLLKLMSIELMMLSNYLILCCLLLFLPSIFSSISASAAIIELCMHFKRWTVLGVTNSMWNGMA